MIRIVRAALIAGAAALPACRHCEEHQAAARVCLPELAAAQTQLTLQAADTCTSPCSFDNLACSATIDGESGAVRLTVLTTACEYSGACAQVCVRKDVSCAVPPLPAGDRTVIVNGTVAGTLHVGADGTTQCSLPAGPLPLP